MHCHEMLFLVPGYTATTFLSFAPCRVLPPMDESITDSGSELLETLAAVHCLGQGWLWFVWWSIRGMIRNCDWPGNGLRSVEWNGWSWSFGICHGNSDPSLPWWPWKWCSLTSTYSVLSQIHTMKYYSHCWPLKDRFSRPVWSNNDSPG